HPLPGRAGGEGQAGGTNRQPLDLPGGRRQPARAQGSPRLLGGAERRREVLARGGDRVEEPRSRRRVDRLRGRTERLSRGDRINLPASAGTIVHRPSAAEFAWLRLVEGAQGSGGRA